MRKNIVRSLFFIVVILISLSFVSAAYADPGKGKGSDKVTICHVPPGNPANSHTITVSENAVPAHLAHGDYLGECTTPPEPPQPPEPPVDPEDPETPDNPDEPQEPDQPDTPAEPTEPETPVTGDQPTWQPEWQDEEVQLEAVATQRMWSDGFMECDFVAVERTNNRSILAWDESDVTIFEGFWEYNFHEVNVTDRFVNARDGHPSISPDCRSIVAERDDEIVVYSADSETQEEPKLIGEGTDPDFCEDFTIVLVDNDGQLILTDQARTIWRPLGVFGHDPECATQERGWIYYIDQYGQGRKVSSSGEWYGSQTAGFNGEYVRENNGTVFYRASEEETMEVLMTESTELGFVVSRAMVPAISVEATDLAIRQDSSEAAEIKGDQVWYSPSWMASEIYPVTTWDSKAQYSHIDGR